MGIEVGSGVLVRVPRGRPNAWEVVTVTGVVEAIEPRAWGTDVLVRLDHPEVVGPDSSEPVARLSVSVGSPSLCEAW